jgi:serine/threonine-protein kinase
LFLEQRSNSVRRVKVLDFGVSKSLLGAQMTNAALTQTANLVGSPLYMSPEQLESSRDVDARADIWGLGVVMYELIAGVPPFAAASIPQLIAAVINERPRRFPSELVPRVPPELEAVIMRTLSKDRRDRPASVDALMEELQPFAAPLTAASRTTHVSGSERTLAAGNKSGPRSGRLSPTQTSQTPVSWDRDDAGAPSRARWAIGAVLIVLVAAAALFAYSKYQGVDPGLAKPLPQEGVETPDVGAAARTVEEPTELPRGTMPDAPAEDLAAKAGVLGSTGASAAPQPAAAVDPGPAVSPQGVVADKQPALALPQPSAAKPVAVAPRPAVNPVPIAKPAAAAQPGTGSKGAPPRGQISDFGGRR